MGSALRRVSDGLRLREYSILTNSLGNEMIDYEKLKEAHELANHRNDRWIWISTKYSAQEHEIEYRLEIGLTINDSDEYVFHDIDDLITKLRELMHPKAKYGVGDIVYVYLHG